MEAAKVEAVPGARPVNDIEVGTWPSAELQGLNLKDTAC